MTSLITCKIDYHSDSVLCFDPQKILAKIKVAFPDAEIDWLDLSAAEVESITDYIETKPTMPEDQRRMMQNQIAGKQQRMGPAFRFRQSDSIEGRVNRYSLVFRSSGKFTNGELQSIRAFIESLGIDQITTTEIDIPAPD